jgi:hypothetical protein
MHADGCTCGHCSWLSLHGKIENEEIYHRPAELIYEMRLKKSDELRVLFVDWMGSDQVVLDLVKCDDIIAYGIACHWPFLVSKSPICQVCLFREGHGTSCP